MGAWMVFLCRIASCGLCDFFDWHDHLVSLPPSYATCKNLAQAILKRIFHTTTPMQHCIYKHLTRHHALCDICCA